MDLLGNVENDYCQKCHRERAYCIHNVKTDDF